MNQRNPIMKWIASAVIFTFFVTNLGITPDTFAATGVPGPEVSSLTVGTLAIPAELGQVTDTVAGDPTAPAFIHIQSAHGNYAAEKNIEKLLGYLKKNSSVKLMLLEGAAHKLHPELFRLFPDHPDFNRKVTDKLMQEGYLTGPESFLIGSSDEIEGWGIENLDAYKKDREAFIKVVKADKDAQAYLMKLRASIGNRFSSKLNKDLLNLVRQEEALATGTVSFEGWLKILREASAKHLKLDLSDAFYQDQYPFLIRYFRLQAIGSKIDREKARREADAFLNNLASRKVSRDILRSFKALLQFPEKDLLRTVSRTAEGYSTLRRVFDLAFSKLPKDFSMTPWPSWTLYAQYLILMQEMEGKGLHEETLKLKDKIFETLTKTDAEKAYLAETRELHLLRRLFSLELTRSEYEELRGSGLVLGDSKKKETKTRDESLATSLAVQFLFATALDFYETAVVREEKMFQNAVNRMGEQKQRRAVIVTGGFHADGLKKLAMSQNCSYIQITPRIQEVTNQDREVYLRSILGRREFQTSQMSRALVTVLQDMGPQEAVALRAEIRGVIKGMITTEPVLVRSALLRAFSFSIFSSEPSLRPALVRSESRIDATKYPENQSVARDQKEASGIFRHLEIFEIAKELLSPFAVAVWYPVAFIVVQIVFPEDLPLAGMNVRAYVEIGCLMVWPLMFAGALLARPKIKHHIEKLQSQKRSADRVAEDLRIKAKIAAARRQDPVLDLIISKEPAIMLDAAKALVAEAQSMKNKHGDFQIVYHLGDVIGTHLEGVGDYTEGDSYMMHGRYTASGSYDSYVEVNDYGPSYWTIEPPKSASVMEKATKEHRSETRLTTEQEEQTNKALSDIESKPWDGPANGNGVERRVVATVALGRFYAEAVKALRKFNPLVKIRRQLNLIRQLNTSYSKDGTMVPSHIQGIAYGHLAMLSDGLLDPRTLRGIMIFVDGVRKDQNSEAGWLISITEDDLLEKLGPNRRMDIFSDDGNVIPDVFGSRTAKGIRYWSHPEEPGNFISTEEIYGILLRSHEGLPLPKSVLRSETRLTPAQEKQFQKMSNVTPRRSVAQTLVLAAVMGAMGMATPAAKSVDEVLVPTNRVVVQTDSQIATQKTLSEEDERRFQAALYDLKDSNFKRSAAAAELLCSLDGRRAVEFLIEALKSDYGYAAGNAAIALGKLKDPRAIESLIGAMRRSYFSLGTNREAADALSEIQHPRVVSALKDALSSSKGWDHHFRYYTAKVLGKGKDPRAISMLFKLANDELSSVREAALEELSHSKLTKSQWLRYQFKAHPFAFVFTGLLPVLGLALGFVVRRIILFRARKAKELAEWLKARSLERDNEVGSGSSDDYDQATDPYNSASFSSPTQAWRIMALVPFPLLTGLASSGDGIQELIEKMGPPVMGFVVALLILRPIIRFFARMGNSLYGISDERGFFSGVSDVRVRAAYRAGQIKDRSAVPQLIQLLKDEEAPVRQTAAWALSEIQDPSTVLALCEVLETDRNDQVKINAATALDGMVDVRSVPALVNAMNDKNSIVRQAASAALGRVALGKTFLRQRLANAAEYARTGRARHPWMVPAFIKGLADNDEGVRINSVLGLWMTMDPAGLPALESMIHDRNPKISGNAAKAIQQIKAMTSRSEIRTNVAPVAAHVSVPDTSNLGAKIGTATRVAANTVSPLLSVSPAYAAEIAPELFAGTVHYQKTPAVPSEFSKKWPVLNKIINRFATADAERMVIDERQGIPDAASVLPLATFARYNPKAAVVLALIANISEVAAFEKDLARRSENSMLPRNFKVQAFAHEGEFVAEFNEFYNSSVPFGRPVALITDREDSVVTRKIGSRRHLLSVVGAQNPLEQTASTLLAADKLLDESIWSLGYHFVSAEKLGGLDALMAELTNYVAAQARMLASV